MKSFLALALLLITIAAPANAQNSKPMTNAQFTALLNQTDDLVRHIMKYDQDGDYYDAAKMAQKCAEIAEQLPLNVEISCEAEYAQDLETGKGVSVDKANAFEIFKNFYVRNPPWNLPRLAELYLDGVGTKPDPVEAAVLNWRTEHGEASFWGPGWGMSACFKDDDGCGKPPNGNPGPM